MHSSVHVAASSSMLAAEGWRVSSSKTAQGCSLLCACAASHRACGRRGADSVEQQEASAAAAQKKKRNKADRKRAAAVRAGSVDQQHSSSGIFSFDGAQEGEGARSSALASVLTWDSLPHHQIIG